nr:1,5-anhydro-D-fructose reductase-like [Cherax quadricarinatus]
MESPTTNVKDELGVYTRRVKLLNTDNLSIPILGYSSVKGISAVVQRKCMTRAINNEIKMLDTAYSDMCEKEMGLMLDALWHRGDNRKDYFIMSKVPLTGNKENLVGRFLIQTLKNLNLNYLDVYFLEGPVGLKWRSDAEVMPRYPATGKLQLDMTTDIVKVWLAMETQFYAGRTRFIGLCHFNMDQVSRILEGCNVKPHFIQLDVNAYSMRHSERYSLVKLGINVIATYSLGNPDLQIDHKARLRNNASVRNIARQHGVNAASVLIKFLLYHNIITLLKGVSMTDVGHICTDLPRFTLTDENIYSLNRLVIPGAGRLQEFPDYKGCMSHPEFPFFEDYNVKYRKIEWSTDTVYKGEHKKKKWLSENYKPPNRVKLEDRRSPPVIPHPVFKKLNCKPAYCPT